MDAAAKKMEAAKAKTEYDGSGDADADDADDGDEAWALRPEWEMGSQPGVWEKWTDYEWETWAKMKEAKDEDGGAGDGAADACPRQEPYVWPGEDEDDETEVEVEAEDDDDEEEDDSNFPPWAKNHKQNNDRKDNTRGKYVVRDGEALFEANDANGGQTYEAGMGRKRGRTRGKGSVVRQKGKAKKDKGKKGPEKGKGKGKGKSKGKENYLGRSFALAESAMSGQNKLIDLLMKKEAGLQTMQEAKAEVKDEWGWNDEDDWWSRGSSSQQW